MKNNLKTMNAEERAEANRASFESYSVGRSAEELKFSNTIPSKFRLGWLRSRAGQASPRQMIKSKCQECVGYEEVVKRVGGCRSTICPLWTERPYQNDEADSDQE